MERDIEKMVCDCLQEAVDEACKAWSADGRCAALDKDAQGCMAAPGQCRARRWRDALEMAKRRLEEEDLTLEEAAVLDDVDHPRHYAEGFSHGAEVIDITENLNFNRGNVVKYVARAGRKDPAKEREDLLKAAWYLHRELDRMEDRL